MVCTKGNVALAANEQDIKSKDLSNSKDVQEFMDKFFTSNMQKYKIPGSAVVVVKDGKEVFKTGYFTE